MPLRVAIFGGGISGLTTAHELLDHYGNDVSITLYEKNNEVGGMARSTWINTLKYGSLPSEHSWRGYAPFYYNFFDLAKRIPITPLRPHGRTVYDNLSKPINFILPTNDGIAMTPTWSDWLIGSYYMSKSICADERNDIYKTISFKRLIEPKLSQGGIDNYIKMLGPGLGLDQDMTSVATVAKFVETMDFKQWSVMNQPTNMALFDPWVSLLLSKGMNIQYNSKLSQIHMSNEGSIAPNIKGCELEDGSMIYADIYVMATDPYSLADVIRNSPDLKHIVSNLYGYSTFNGIISRPNYYQCPELKKVLMTSNIPSIPQISFRYGFDIPYTSTNSNDVYAFPDSEFNITLYFQDKFWSSSNVQLPFKSYWSGTACVTNVPGPLYGKPATELTDEEFLNECWYQITNRGSNRIGIDMMYISSMPAPVYGEVWNYRNEPPKWSNTIYTYKYRPSQKTNINNMYLTGAHTKTTMDIYSMEGAAESGKLVASMIIGGCIDVYKHVRLRLLKKIDNLLYTLGLPSIVDVLLFMLCIVVAMITQSILI